MNKDSADNQIFSDEAALSLETTEEPDTGNKMIADLIAVRHAHELTQADVAQRMGTSIKAVQDFEKEDSDPRLSQIRRYALSVEAMIRHKLTMLDENSNQIASEPQDESDNKTVTSSNRIDFPLAG